MKFVAEIDEKELKELIRTHIARKLGLELEDTDIQIEVKSKQNYKSEWESAAFRASITKHDA